MYGILIHTRVDTDTIHGHIAQLLARFRTLLARYPHPSCGSPGKKVQVASPRPAEVVFNTQAPLASLFIHLNDSPAPGPLPPPTFPRSTIKINYFSLLINLRPAPSFKELKKKKKKSLRPAQASREINLEAGFMWRGHPQTIGVIK